MRHAFLLAGTLLLAAVLVACGSSDDNGTAPQPSAEAEASDDGPPSGTVRETATIALTVFPTRQAGTPRPRSEQGTPLPTVPPPTMTPVTISAFDGSTRLTAFLSGSCRLIDGGAEMTISSRALISGPGELARLRLIVNSEVIDEVGQTPDRDTKRTATLKVPEGTRYHAQLIADSNNKMRSSANMSIACPTR